MQQEEEVDPAVEMEFEELQQDMRNAAMLEVVSCGAQGAAGAVQHRSQWVEPAPQVTAPAGADAEQAAEVEQMYREIQQNTQDSGSGRQAADGSDTAGRLLWSTARSECGKDHCRRQQEAEGTTQAAAEQELQGSGSSSKRAKARQSMQEWMWAAAEWRRAGETSDLSVEKQSWSP